MNFTEAIATVRRLKPLVVRQEGMLVMQRAQLEHMVSMACGWAFALGQGLPDITDEEMREAVKAWNAEQGAELVVVP